MTIEDSIKKLDEIGKKSLDDLIEEQRISRGQETAQEDQAAARKEAHARTVAQREVAHLLPLASELCLKIAEEAIETGMVPNTDEISRKMGIILTGAHMEHKQRKGPD